MAPSPARTQVVGPVTDNGIADSIDDQRGRDGDSDQAGVETGNLAVKQKQEIVEAAILDAIRDRSKAVGGLEAQAQGR